MTDGYNLVFKVLIYYSLLQHYKSEITVDRSYFSSVTYSKCTVIPGNFTWLGQVLEKNCLQNSLFKVRQNRRDDDEVDVGSYTMALWKSDGTRTFEVETPHCTCWRTRLERRSKIIARQTAQCM